MKRFEAAGWDATRIDGHDPEAIAARDRKRASNPTGPTLIACRTMIGFGAPTKEGTAKAHGSPLGKDEIEGAREKLGWTDAAVRGSCRYSRRLARRRARGGRA